MRVIIVGVLGSVRGDASESMTRCSPTAAGRASEYGMRRHVSSSSPKRTAGLAEGVAYGSCRSARARCDLRKVGAKLSRKRTGVDRGRADGVRRQPYGDAVARAGVAAQQQRELKAAASPADSGRHGSRLVDAPRTLRRPPAAHRTARATTATPRSAEQQPAAGFAVPEKASPTGAADGWRACPGTTDDRGHAIDTLGCPSR